MNILSTELERYISMRRGLGFTLTSQAPVLRKFVAFAESEGVDYVTTDLFLRWRAAYGSANNDTWSNRFVAVRIFAQWVQGIDPRNEIPPRGLIPRRASRPRPFIYTDEQVRAIVGAAAQLPSAYGLQGLTWSTLFGLIAVTGLRISEAVGMDNEDVDLGHGVLTVRRGKNGKSRIVVITGCTAAHLGAYQVERDRLIGQQPVPFFLTESGRRPSRSAAEYRFARLSQTIGLRAPQTDLRLGRGPRIHDLRHTFAVRTIINWYRNGLDPDREMYKLSAYLGHDKPADTYWYIEAVPELLALAAERATQSIDKKGGVR